MEIHPDVIGWAASAILLATLVRQIAAQVKDPEARGVSRWLFIGQSAASVGFIVYSAMLDNTVFVVTNSCILATALVGQGTLWWRKRRRERGVG
jgi:MtN3 and saliva related transmembrane protein